MIRILFNHRASSKSQKPRMYIRGSELQAHELNTVRIIPGGSESKMRTPRMILQRGWWMLFGLVAALMLGTPVARGVDFSRDTAPGKWFEPLIPEAMPPMQFPIYFNDLDKIKAEVFAGRYRLALQ